jgi:hypothetical protein
MLSKIKNKNQYLFFTSNFFFKKTQAIVPSLSQTSGLYYKLMTIVNDNSRVVNKLEASLTDDDRVVIYDQHMFIVQATVCTIK